MWQGIVDWIRERRGSWVLVAVIAVLALAAWQFWRVAAAAYGAEAGLVQGSLGSRLAVAALAMAALFATLRLFDWIAGRRFAGVLETVTMVPMATAVYYGARFLGVALLLGQILG